jgi:hypothetical protein
MGWFALLCAAGAAVFAALPVPGAGLYLAIGLGIFGAAAGLAGYRRTEDTAPTRLAGAAAVALGLLAALAGAARYALTLAALSYLERFIT